MRLPVQLLLRVRKSCAPRRITLPLAAMVAGLTAAQLPAQTPGDGAPLQDVHPALQLVNIRPASFQPRVGGMKFLEDGRLAVVTWDGNAASHDPPAERGRLYLLTGVDQDDRSQVQVQQIATNLQEPLGLEVVGNDFYVSEREALVRISDANGDGTYDAPVDVKRFASGISRHEYYMGIHARDGWIYGSHTLANNPGGAAMEPQPNNNRGTFLRVKISDGTVEYLAGGLREPFGLGEGPEGEWFTTDVQGTWLPANKLIHLQKDKFYGAVQAQNPSLFANNAAQAAPPAVYLPQGAVAAAPSEPILMPNGVYRGQMIMGDVRQGGLGRIFLEKVKGEYQGAFFRFTGGLEVGVSRLAINPDKTALFAGGVGVLGGNWLWLDTQYGLQKLKFTGKDAFEVLAVRSRREGFDLEFTRPVQTGLTAANFEVRTWRYNPTSGYGGPNVDEHNLSVTQVQSFDGGKRVGVSVSGMKTGYVVRIRLNNVKSAAGDNPWVTEAWYTLNAISDDPMGTPIPVSLASRKAAFKAPRAAWVGPSPTFRERDGLGRKITDFR